MCEGVGSVKYFLTVIEAAELVTQLVEKYEKQKAELEKSPPKKLPSAEKLHLLSKLLSSERLVSTEKRVSSERLVSSDRRVSSEKIVSSERMVSLSTERLVSSVEKVISAERIPVDENQRENVVQSETRRTRFTR